MNVTKLYNFIITILLFLSFYIIYEILNHNVELKRQIVVLKNKNIFLSDQNFILKESINQLEKMKNNSNIGDLITNIIKIIAIYLKK